MFLLVYTLTMANTVPNYSNAGLFFAPAELDGLQIGDTL